MCIRGGRPSKDFTVEDHIIIFGGPGNSLDRNLNYEIEDDLNNIAKISRHTNVGFFSPFEHYDWPWMTRCVLNVN
jgi:hypothetical protein